MQILKDPFTYCRDDGLHASWIDHLLCSKAIDGKVDKIEIHYSYQCSNHKPLSVIISGLAIEPYDSSIDNVLSKEYLQWDKINISAYQHT